jgi:hypothetical protein
MPREPKKSKISTIDHLLRPTITVGNGLCAVPKRSPAGADAHIGGTLGVPKCQIGALDVTLEEMQILSLLKKDSKLTQKQLADLIGKSDRTVKRITVSLEAKGLIERVGGKRFGYWKVNAQ